MVTASNYADYSDSNKFFEYWSNLYKTDPERFEAERKTEIEKVITSAPLERQQMLHQLQWTIDGERRKAKNPIDGMIRLNKMMWRQLRAKNGFFSLVGHFSRLSKCLVELGEDLQKKDATVLTFKKD